MSARPKDLVEYPESDGEPMAETELHAQLMIDLRFALQRRFRAVPDVYVGINMLMYWVEGDPYKSKAPDVFFVRGAPKEPPRRTWQVWKEGKAPDVVFEVSSRKTWREDLYDKWQLYARLGVREYFLFDPEYDYLPEPLMAWRLEEGQFFPLLPENGCVLSEALGLELCDTGTTLRLRDPQTGELLPTSEEEADARQIAEALWEDAETRAEQEAAARQEAECRAARLAAQLRALGLDPDAA